MTDTQTPITTKTYIKYESTAECGDRSYHFKIEEVPSRDVAQLPLPGWVHCFEYYDVKVMIDSEGMELKSEPFNTLRYGVKEGEKDIVTLAEMKAMNRKQTFSFMDETDRAGGYQDDAHKMRVWKYTISEMEKNGDQGRHKISYWSLEDGLDAPLREYWTDLKSYDNRIYIDRATRKQLFPKPAPTDNAPVLDAAHG